MGPVAGSLNAEIFYCPQPPNDALILRAQVGITHLSKLNQYQTLTTNSFPGKWTSGLCGCVKLQTDLFFIILEVLWDMQVLLDMQLILELDLKI